MAVINMAALRGALAPGQRLIGLDLGSKVIGVALSDVGFCLPPLTAGSSAASWRRTLRI